MVAKSYSKLKQINEPFKENGKMYVTVVTEKGAQKVVRWYSEAEYAKMYPEVTIDKTKDPYYKSQKEVLGFSKGYITIFKGVTPENEWWFEQNQYCRWARWWGWYVPSTFAVPCDYPKGVVSVRLTWGPMGGEGDWLKDEATIKKHICDTFLAVSVKKSGISKPQGKIGDRLDIRIKVIGKQTTENKRFHSTSYLYEMQDEKGNCYKWKTEAKDWTVGTEHHIRGTVKEFDELNGEPCTVLTRCIEQK